MRSLIACSIVFSICASICCADPLSNAPPIRVYLAQNLPDANGRLLLFIKPHGDNETASPRAIEVDIMHPTAVTIVGQDTKSFGVERSIRVPNSAQSSPASIATLPPGDYWIQAVLDRSGLYARRFARSPGDYESAVEHLRLPLARETALTLNAIVPLDDPWHPNMADRDTATMLAKARARVIDFPIASRVLSAFAHRPSSLETWVLLPPGYSSRGRKTWPTVFVLGAYGSYHRSKNDVWFMAYLAKLSDEGKLPPLIWVFPDYATESGVSEFLDSPSNGPWGRALVSELLPTVERSFRMDSRQNGRFLWGHSSGGWASLWLQIHYPRVFGGAWSTAPDSCDFNDFIGVNLYGPKANMFVDSEGNAYPIAREHGQVIATIHDWTHAEDVLGHVGGVLRSYDYIFSPIGFDGAPAFMFDHDSGRIDPVIVDYWKKHFDLGQIISQLPAQSRAMLNGKLRIAVGTEDTHYLDGSVHLLQGHLQRAGIKADVQFLAGRDHNNLYNDGMLERFAKEMWQTARPETQSRR